jgi:phosphoribosylglycinamide formyltransferase-1
LIDAPDLGAVITRVITDRDGIEALDRAQRARIPTTILPSGDFASRQEFSDAIGAAAAEAGAETLVLAGFMRVLAPGLIARFPQHILNIHPSLLPAFPGSHAVDQALEHGVKVTGVTVHFVDEQVDHGPIIAQRAVPVLPDDDVASLHARIQVEEHDLYPAVVRAFAQGRISLVGGKVVWA